MPFSPLSRSSHRALSLRPVIVMSSNFISILMSFHSSISWHYAADRKWHFSINIIILVNIMLARSHLISSFRLPLSSRHRLDFPFEATAHRLEESSYLLASAVSFFIVILLLEIFSRYIQPHVKLYEEYRFCFDWLYSLPWYDLVLILI